MRWKRWRWDEEEERGGARVERGGAMVEVIWGEPHWGYPVTEGEWGSRFGLGGRNPIWEISVWAKDSRGGCRVVFGANPPMRWSKTFERVPQNGMLILKDWWPKTLGSQWRLQIKVFVRTLCWRVRIQDGGLGRTQPLWVPEMCPGSAQDETGCAGEFCLKIYVFCLQSQQDSFLLCR